MHKIKILLSSLLAIFAFAACDTANLTGVEDTTPVERISFTLNGKAPIVAAPDEEVTYSFKIAYTEGLASVKTSLDGQVVEGSEMTWDNAPTEVDYTFNYTVSSTQYGETLDFVFTATGINGYTYSVDYALWVSANSVEFTAKLPDEIPAQIYSNESVQFDLNIECGLKLKSVTVTKNGAAYASKTDFTTEKVFQYPFSYTPATEDIGKDIEFHFVVTDIANNTAEAHYTVNVVKADLVGKMIYEELFDTSMSISTTTEYNTTAGGISGGGATQFDATNIVKYNTTYVSDPNNPDGELIVNQGAMEGCTVYGGDLSSLIYTADGVNSCLSKYDTSSVKYVYGTYLWMRKAKKGWFRVDGIKLHGATSFKLTYSQAGGTLFVEYSLDGGETWTEVVTTSTGAETHEKKFSIPNSAETMSMRFSEKDGTAHLRFDNIKLVEII